MTSINSTTHPHTWGKRCQCPTHTFLALIIPVAVVTAFPCCDSAWTLSLSPDKKQTRNARELMPQEQSSAKHRWKFKINSSALLTPQMGQPLGMFYMVSQNSRARLSLSLSTVVICLILWLLAAFPSLSHFPTPLPVLPVSLRNKALVHKTLSQALLPGQPKSKQQF